MQQVDINEHVVMMSVYTAEVDVADAQAKGYILHMCVHTVHGLASGPDRDQYVHELYISHASCSSHDLSNITIKSNRTVRQVSEDFVMTDQAIASLSIRTLITHTDQSDDTSREGQFVQQKKHT